jgi:hypothetical protein
MMHDLVESFVEICQWATVFALALKVIILDRRLHRLETDGVKVGVTIERVDVAPRAPTSKVEQKPN